MKQHVIHYEALKPTEVSVDFGNLDKAKEMTISIKNSKDESSKGTGCRQSKN